MIKPELVHKVALIFFHIVFLQKVGLSISLHDLNNIDLTLHTVDVLIVHFESFNILFVALLVAETFANKHH